MPFALLGSCVPAIIFQRKTVKKRQELLLCWPELIDHLISGMRSGLSIPETLVALAERGPESARPVFTEIKELLLRGGNLDQALERIKKSFDDPMADQVCEVLRFARGTGSRDTAVALRTLGDFIRSDISVRSEIQAKLGWVKNSAIVAAIAPWILLVILSSQPTTLRAYESSSGHFILITGLVMSFLAYAWMGRVGRVSEVPRIFLGHNSDPGASA